MKRLSDVTEQDAREIIKAGYPNFFRTGTWTLTDMSEEIKEPCKKLHARSKAFMFWFFNNCIDIDTTDKNSCTIDESNYDVRLRCYIKAYELDYYVEELHDLLANRNGLITSNEIHTTI